MKNVNIKESDWVIVPAIQGTASKLSRSGYIEILKPPYARVVITYGRKRFRMHFKIKELEYSKKLTEHYNNPKNLI